uniref:Uncharacterized protein n=1 Tax=Arundo donax TaxID=35708 RepID=A0A0A9CSS9_ARUDO
MTGHKHLLYSMLYSISQVSYFLVEAQKYSNSTITYSLTRYEGRGDNVEGRSL